ncbi:hypothetical protein [Pseudomonas guariconensis]|uniref:hypothetical protein n=1 Tax=Pseudomonas guariconensis TaxID=1288410 RepID=UPI00390690F6
MDFDFLSWAFKRSLVATLLYTVACLVLWIVTGAQAGWAALFGGGATWAVLFSVYVSDPKTGYRYFNETRDRHR